jgi:hypothetical protein
MQIPINVIFYYLDDKKLEALNIELRKKEKLAKEPLNPNEMFENSDLSNFDPMNVFNQSILSKQNAEKNTSDINQTDYQRLKKRTGTTTDKINLYRSYMKILDIVVTLLIIFGALLSQYENELYYYHNIKYRVVSTVLMNGIFRNVTNRTKESILSSVSLELYADHKLDPNETFTLNNITDNIDWEFVNYEEDYKPSEFTKVLIFLEIPPSCTILRHLILYTTLGSSNKF